MVIVTVESIAQLSKEGKTVGGEGTPISRVGVGIGIRKGAARPDISTPEAIKRAMLGAKAIAYGSQSARARLTSRECSTRSGSPTQ